MKNLLRFVLPLVAIVYLSSCNTHTDKEYAELQATNDSLMNLLQGSNQIPLAGKIVLQTIKLSEIREGVKTLHDCAKDAKEIYIPISWKFEEAQLDDMLLDINVGSGVEDAKGIMAYPIIDPVKKILKIALVPYYEKGGKQYHYKVDPENVGAYDFSTICPPSSDCIENASIVTDIVLTDQHKFNSYDFIGNGVSERFK